MSIYIFPPGAAIIASERTHPKSPPHLARDVCIVYCQMRGSSHMRQGQIALDWLNLLIAAPQLDVRLASQDYKYFTLLYNKPLF